MLRHELYRAFRNKKFFAVVIVGIIIATAAFYADSWHMVRTQREIMNKTQMGLLFKSKADVSATPQEAWIGFGFSAWSNALYYIMPLLGVFAYGTSYQSDIKSGYYNNIIIRGSKAKYYVSKLVSVFVSGGVSCTIPLIANLLLCMMYFPMGPSAPEIFPVNIKNWNVFGDLFFVSPLLYITIYILFDFCFFGIINCVCLSVSCIEDNYFMVLLAPFMYYFAFHAVNIWTLGNWRHSPQRYSQMQYLMYDTLPIMALHIAPIIISLIPYFMRAVKGRDSWLH